MTGTINRDFRTGVMFPPPPPPPSPCKPPMPCLPGAHDRSPDGPSGIVCLLRHSRPIIRSGIYWCLKSPGGRRISGGAKAHPTVLSTGILYLAWFGPIIDQDKATVGYSQEVPCSALPTGYPSTGCGRPLLQEHVAGMQAGSDSFALLRKSSVYESTSQSHESVHVKDGKTGYHAAAKLLR